MTSGYLPPSAGARFLRAVKTGKDRRVLAPLYLPELVYRAAREQHLAGLLEGAAGTGTARTG